MFMPLDLHYSIFLHKQMLTVLGSPFLGLWLFCSQTFIFCSYTSVFGNWKEVFIVPLFTRLKSAKYMAMLVTNVLQAMGEIFPSEELWFSWSDKGKKETGWMKKKSLCYQPFCCRIFLPHCSDVTQSTFHQDQPCKHGGPLPSPFMPGLHRWAH